MSDSDEPMLGILFREADITTPTQDNVQSNSNVADDTRSEEEQRDPNAPSLRNIVVCLDGTANAFGPRNSNVIKLFSILELSDKQLGYYDSGVGTYIKEARAMSNSIAQKVQKTVDFAVAWGFKDHVLNAYRVRPIANRHSYCIADIHCSSKYLMNHYRNGDALYIFGFSRGAYTARALAGMLERVGLLPPGCEDQVPLAYEVYSDPKAVNKRDNIVDRNDSKKPKLSDEELADELVRHYKDIFGRSSNVQVEFLGVWDTVSSVGLWYPVDLPFAAGVNEVKYLRHALALNERRVKFQPEFRHANANLEPEFFDDHQIAFPPMIVWVPPPPTPRPPAQYGGFAFDLELNLHLDVMTIPGRTAGWMYRSHFRKNQMCRSKEVWFSGCHSDIGGGNDQNFEHSLSNIPFRWMVREANRCGLLIDRLSLARHHAYKRTFEAVWAKISFDLGDIHPEWDQKIMQERVRYHEQLKLASVIKIAAAEDTSGRLINDSGENKDVRKPIQESLIGYLYRGLEHVPMKKWSYREAKAGNSASHKGAPRQIQTDQLLHGSVLTRVKHDFGYPLEQKISPSRLALLGNRLGLLPKPIADSDKFQNWARLPSRGEAVDWHWPEGWEDLKSRTWDEIFERDIPADGQYLY